MASSKSQLVIGYLSAVGNWITATAAASCSQTLQAAIPNFQLSLTRSLIQSVIYLIGGKLAGADFKVKREILPGLLYFGLLYLMLNVGYYGSTTYLPLTEAFGGKIIASIVTAFIHSKLVYNIDVTKSKIASLLVCVVGIILAAQPPWMFDQYTRSFDVTPSENTSYAAHPMNISNQYETKVNTRKVLLGYTLSLLGGAAMGLMFDVNCIMLKEVTPIVKVTYANIICMIGSVALMFYLDEPVLVITLTQFMLVLGHGVLSAIASFLFVQAAHYIAGPTLSALYSFEMITLIISQYTVMHSVQPGNDNWVEVLGCLIIIFGASVPSLVDILEERANSNELP